MRMSSVSIFFMSVELPFWENEKGRRKVGDLRDKDEDEDVNEDKNHTDGLMLSLETFPE
jgi:hypothetical protein